MTPVATPLQARSAGPRQDAPAPPESAEESTRPFEGPAHTPARDLLAHFGRWVGDDLDELLAEVYRTRSKVLL
jgi:hypothetical protein